MIEIAHETVRLLEEHVTEIYPKEACGLLLGSWDHTSSIRRVQLAYLAKNIRSDRLEDQYEIDPRDYLQAERIGRKNGTEIIGTYHSHPDHYAVPSETDLCDAREVWGRVESWSYLIIEVRDNKVIRMRSWVLKEEKFIEEDLIVQAMGDLNL